MSATGSTSPRAFSPALGVAAHPGGRRGHDRWGPRPGRSSDLGLRGQILVGSVLLALPAVVALLLLRRDSWRETLGLAAPAPRLLGLSVLLGAALWILSIGLMELQSLAAAPSSGVPRGLPGHPPGPGAAGRPRRPRLGDGDRHRPRGRGGARSPAGSCFRPSSASCAPAGAVAVSALLFAAMHLDLYRFLFTLTIGLVLGVVRLQDRLAVAADRRPRHPEHRHLPGGAAGRRPDARRPTPPSPCWGSAAWWSARRCALPVLRALRASVDSSRTDA